MKTLHRPDLFAWSRFDEARDIDFHGLCIARKEGNILIDPLPMDAHDRAHLAALGGATCIVITNSDHVRDAAFLAAELGAEVVGPAAERDTLSSVCHRFVGEGDEVVPGLRVLALAGSKTPGELALLWRDTTLITGDLVRAHRAGGLTLLPDTKLADRDAAVASLLRLASMPAVEAVLVGDGFQVFRQGHLLLRELYEAVAN